MPAVEPARFALTKTQPPRPRADLIRRDALESALGVALASQRLVVLQAPAGWGKTSALARGLARLPAGTAMAWVSADEDDDVPRFLAALTTALAPLDLPWRVAPGALGLLSESQRGVRLVADELVNALAGAPVERGLVVVDDVHRLADAPLFELLAALVERLPPHWGLVLASRTEPPLPMARLRARGELAEFRQNELRFDTGEVQALLAAHGHASAQADELLRRTAGWAAGLRLLLSVGAQGMPQAAATSARHIFDYLADEVLAEATPAMRQFLLRCAVLPELSPARCAHVSGLAQAAALFDQVEREGLFVTTLDPAGRTLRLHDLFRDFLEDRLQRDHADELPALLQRAADGEPDLVRAVTWLVRAGAWERAAAELARRGPALVPQGGRHGIERLLALFPDAELARHPALFVLRGLCEFNAFDFAGCAESMARAVAGFDAAGRPADALPARILQHTAELSSGLQARAAAGYARLRAEHLDGAPGALTAFFSAWQAYAEHRPGDIAPAFAQALRLFEDCPDPQDWQMAYFVSMLAGIQGMEPLLVRHELGALRMAGDGASLLRLGVYHSRAARAFCGGRLDEAARWLHTADADLHWLGRPRSVLTENLMLHLAVDAARGDAAACDAAAAQLRADMADSPLANQRSHGGSMLLADARARWALGDAAAVRRVAAEIEQARNPFEWAHAQAERCTAAGMVALLDGRLADAERLLMPGPGPIEDQLTCRGSMSLLLCVDAQRRQGRLDGAAATLRRWLADLRQGGAVGGVLLAGRAVMDGLAEAAWGSRLDAGEQAQLQALVALARDAATGTAPPAAPAVPEPGAAPASPSAAVLPAGLTEREAEVVALMAAGRSNKLIARELDLSPFTVKRHVANILGKTGLSSRTQVAAWWLAQRPVA